MKHRSNTVTHRDAQTHIVVAGSHWWNLRWCLSVCVSTRRRNLFPRVLLQPPGHLSGRITTLRAGAQRARLIVISPPKVTGRSGHCQYSDCQESCGLGIPSQRCPGYRWMKAGHLEVGAAFCPALGGIARFEIESRTRSNARGRIDVEEGAETPGEAPHVQR